MSSRYYLETNAILERSAELFKVISQENIGARLKQLQFNWDANTLNADADIVPILRTYNYLESGPAGLGVNRAGLLFLSRLLLHFDQDRLGPDIFGNLNEKYHDFEVISSGKNSVVVKAVHKLLDTRIVLKLVRPGASTDITKSIGRLSTLSSNTAILQPIDLLEVKTRDLLGKPVTVACLVFPFVEGKTFREFLTQENHHLNSQVVISFARQIGFALRELERIGAYHGDLHEGNILVDQFSKDGIKFKIVDISFDAMGSLPFEVCRNNDLINFKQHIWRIISVQKAFISRISLRRYIGTRNYQKIMAVLSEGADSFVNVCQILESDVEYASYKADKETFLEKKFRSPKSFRLQRYEEITDPTVAVRLFVPFAPLMDKIVVFGNVFVSGNRGSGKSTYLASLAFFPQAEETIVDFKQTFGIYFPCRQGEFRPLSSRDSWSLGFERAVITNVVALKIIRRTLETISSGVVSGKIAYPASLQRLREFIASLVPAPGIVSVENDIQSELENLVATMIRVEMEEIARLPSVVKISGVELDGRRLLEFFTTIRDTFNELFGARFHLLFDDAGLPYVPLSVQKVINDLILTSNAIFCVKLTAEKYTYKFQGSSNKVLENGQDYFEHDISQILFIGSGSSGLSPAILEEYFRRIVEKRLSHFSYKSVVITDYLGDKLIPLDRLLHLLAAGRKDAYYCGWTTVWNIADRTPRNLLELVSEIFTVGRVERDTDPSVVSKRNQNTAIQTISEKRLDSLSQISGSISIHGKSVSLGRHLFETTVALGSTFRRYLKASGHSARKRQHLAIERNDSGELSPEAEGVLKKMLTFGILDSGRAVYAWDDETKKPLYVLNRIYCPAFAIGYHRDDHLRLSKGKLEQLMLDPQRFMKEGTKRLRDANMVGPDDLFGSDVDDSK